MGVVEFALIAVVYLYILYWLVNDARKRGKTAWAWGLIYLVNPVLGLLFYFVLKFYDYEVKL